MALANITQLEPFNIDTSATFTFANAAVTANITAGNVKTNNLLYANGTAWTFGQPAGGTDTHVQFNDGGNFGGNSQFTYAKTTNTLTVGNISAGNLTISGVSTLGNVANIKISGGSANYVLKTDGAGNLSWTAMTGGGASGVGIGGVDAFTADGSGNTYTLASTPTSANSISVNIDGVVQLHSSFTLSGNVVTLLGTPVNGAKVEVMSFSSGGAVGSNTQVQFNDSGNLAGNAGMTFNKTTGTFNANVITANGAPVATTGKSIAMAIVFGF